MKLNLITCATVLVLASSPVLAEETSQPVAEQAQPQPEIITDSAPKAPRIFEQLDKDKDGKVSQQEAQVSPALVKGFDKIDSDKDGFLSPDEFSQLQVEATQARSYVVLAALPAL